MISHMPVRIDGKTFILSTEDGSAHAVARAHSPDLIELLWIVPSEPITDARTVLEVAGYSILAPHRRVANG